MYTSDERKGVEAAHLFAQKEFENIYLLSGGFDRFAKDFPGMIEGKHVVYQEKKAQPILIPKHI